MFKYRHAAYNLSTGEIVYCANWCHLVRKVARAEKANRKLYAIRGHWRWCHDFGKRWDKEGLPIR